MPLWGLGVKGFVGLLLALVCWRLGWRVWCIAGGLGPRA